MVVQASDGGEMEWVQYFKVTVIVLDQEEAGSVTWTVDPVGTEPAAQDLLEFQAAATLAATVTDPDDGPDTPDQHHVEVVQVGEQHRAVDVDSQHASGRPLTPCRIMRMTTTWGCTCGRWRLTPTTGGPTRKRKTFRTTRCGRPKCRTTRIPEFDPTSVAREVQEGSAGRNVGPPVAATDADGDVLNYTHFYR